MYTFDRNVRVCDIEAEGERIVMMTVKATANTSKEIYKLFVRS